MAISSLERERGVGKTSAVFPRVSRGESLDISGHGVSTPHPLSEGVQKLLTKTVNRPNPLLHEVVSLVGHLPLDQVRAIYKHEKSAAKRVGSESNTSQTAAIPVRNPTMEDRLRARANSGITPKEDGGVFIVVRRPSRPQFESDTAAE